MTLDATSTSFYTDRRQTFPGGLGRPPSDTRPAAGAFLQTFPGDGPRGPAAPTASSLLCTKKLPVKFGGNLGEDQFAKAFFACF